MPLSGKCPECGAPVGGGEKCRKLFDEVLAREFSNLLYFGVHRTTVDCYALQHPEGYCASFKSFAAHLTGLCCAVEFDKDPKMMRAIHIGLNWRLGRNAPALRRAAWCDDDRVRPSKGRPCKSSPSRRGVVEIGVGCVVAVPRTRKKSTKGIGRSSKPRWFSLIMPSEPMRAH